MTPEQIAKSASFDVGFYPDGSGPMIRVWYDVDGGQCQNCIWMENAAGRWVAFDVECADQIIAAVQAAATSVRAILEEARND